MNEWVGFVDDYLRLAQREVLAGAGQVSHEAMLQITDERYTVFDLRRKESERRTAEAEYEHDLADELKKAEKLVQGRRNAGKGS